MNDENSLETELALLKCFGQVQLGDVRDAYMKLAEKHICAYVNDGEETPSIIEAALDNFNTFESSVTDNCITVYAQMLLQLLANKDGHCKQLIVALNVDESLWKVTVMIVETFLQERGIK